jgi:flagellar biosynthesis/type III secretory pathway ATPase
MLHLIIDLGSCGNPRRVYGRNLRDKRYSLLPEVISFGEREDIRTLLNLGICAILGVARGQRMGVWWF